MISIVTNIPFLYFLYMCLQVTVVSNAGDHLQHTHSIYFPFCPVLPLFLYFFLEKMFTISGCCPFPDVSCPPFPRACSPLRLVCYRPQDTVRTFPSLRLCPRKYVQLRNNNLPHKHPTSKENFEFQKFWHSGARSPKCQDASPLSAHASAHNKQQRCASHYLATPSLPLAPYIPFLPRTTLVVSLDNRPHATP